MLPEHLREVEELLLNAFGAQIVVVDVVHDAAELGRDTFGTYLGTLDRRRRVQALVRHCGIVDVGVGEEGWIFASARRRRRRRAA